MDDAVRAKAIGWLQSQRNRLARIADRPDPQFGDDPRFADYVRVRLNRLDSILGDVASDR